MFRHKLNLFVLVIIEPYSSFLAYKPPLTKPKFTWNYFPVI